MRKRILLGAFFLFSIRGFSQNYTSYFTGNSINKTTVPQGGVCVMGGATENDEAMKWFLQRCNGGDVLILRTSGSDGYNDYLYSQLGITVNSVETIVCNNASASNDLYVQQKIQNAEGIWFAGGDQWTYVSYWRNTPVANLVNDAIMNRHIVVGGTSAGMAILGGFYFSAQNGTVTSATALNNPYDADVTVDSASFIKVGYLDSVITDTHYDNPDRRGRHTTFLARVKKDWNLNARGIACDEYTALCIDVNGIAKAYGDFPANDDNVYFIQNNCEIINNSPENCTAGNPLTWNQGNEALKVYNIKGTPTGSNSFDLNDWKTGVGGSWERWWVANGLWQAATTTAINCTTVPVTLLSFSAKKNDQSVLMEWQTTTEENSSHFNIQKSKDGINFESIAMIAAAGNSNTLKEYSYVDKTIFPGTAYYRLQLVDIDMRFRYSKTVAVPFNEGPGFLIYPNPAKSTLFISNNHDPLRKIIVFNTAGRKVMEQLFYTDAVIQTLNISDLDKGLYFLRLYSKDNVATVNSRLVVE